MGPKVVTPTAEQAAALEVLREWPEGLRSLSGPAGTGKTTLLRMIDPDIFLATTGKASRRLTEVTGEKSQTVHSLLYRAPKGDGVLEFIVRQRELDDATVVVDEASMLTPQVLADMRWAWPHRRILLVGDYYQLPPVLDTADAKEWGDDFSVFAEVRGPVLNHVMRSAGGIVRAATHLRETGDVPEMNDDNYAIVRHASPNQYAISAFLEDPDDHVLITWTNQMRMFANRQIRMLRGHQSVLDPGEPVLFRQNSASYGVLNGDVFPVVKIDLRAPRVGPLETVWLELEDGRRVLSTFAKNFEGALPYFGKTDFIAYRKAIKELVRGKKIPGAPVPATYAYCLTAHAAQGSEYRRCTVFLGGTDLRNPYFRKLTTLPNKTTATFGARFLYTAITRGKLHAQLAVP